MGILPMFIFRYTDETPVLHSIWPLRGESGSNDINGLGALIAHLNIKLDS